MAVVTVVVIIDGLVATQRIPITHTFSQAWTENVEVYLMVLQRYVSQLGST